jgi:hypothetical protein
MSNMKIVSMVANSARRVQAEDQAARSALADDLYAALEPIRADLAEMREVVIQLTRDVDRLLRRP